MSRAVKGMGVALLTLVWIALSAWGVLANTPGHPRYSWKVLLSGYFPEYVYEQGRLDTRLPFEELRKRSRINAVAEAADTAPDFSHRIRAGLPDPWR